MGKLELEMEWNWQGASKYANYVTKLPEDGRVYFQILDKAMGRTSKTVPLKIKVTIEWEDLPEEVLKDDDHARRENESFIEEFERIGYSKDRNVTLQELTNAIFVKDGQILYFYHGRVFKDEQAEIVADQNKLKYKKNGQLYSVSALAKYIDTRLELKHDQHGVAGPKYWQTEDGKLLHDLNEKVREKWSKVSKKVKRNRRVLK